MAYNRRSSTAPLFFGNGDHSMALAYDLVKRLHDAFNDLSGIQQASGIPECAEQVSECEDRVVETAKDIFAALTGRRVTDSEQINSAYWSLKIRHDQ